MEQDRKRLFWYAGAAIVTASIVGWLLTATPVQAADLGGNCCADLEERIAEFEATAARKGNQKVSLRVYGQVNKALLHTSGDLEENTVVTENSNEESYFGFAGEANFATGWKAGYVLEIGVGGYDASLDGGLGGFGYGPLTDGGTNDIYVRRSYWFVDSPAGRVAVGLQSQATDGIAELTVANTKVASRMLSLRPIIGPQVLEVADIFDGTRTNAVRYDTPTMAGFVASASWANGSNLGGFGGDDSDVWDVALRWAGEGGGFRAMAGVGYKRGIVIPTLANIGGDGEIETWSGSASVKHMDTGLFVSGAAGQFSLGNDDLQGYHVQAGVERNWTELGATTLYAEYADAKELDLTITGLGVVQAIDAAAMDLYLSARKLDIEDGDATLILGGARIQF